MKEFLNASVGLRVVERSREGMVMRASERSSERESARPHLGQAGVILTSVSTVSGWWLPMES